MRFLSGEDEDSLGSVAFSMQLGKLGGSGYPDDERVEQSFTFQMAVEVWFGKEPDMETGVARKI